MTQTKDGAAAVRRPHVPSWDVLRTAAFAAVAVQHILGAYARRYDIGSSEKVIIAVSFEPLRFAVPLFVMLFGAALFYVYREPPRYVPYLAKRVRQLVLPYAVWTAVYLWYAEKPVTLRGVARGMVYGDASYHLWYVTMILQFVVLVPLFFAVRNGLRRYCTTKRRMIVAPAVLLGAWLVLLACRPSDGWAHQILVTWRTRGFLLWTGYFALGALCGLSPEVFAKWARRLIVPAGLISVGAVGYAMWLSVRTVYQEGVVDFNRVSYFSPVYAVLTMVTILFLYGAAEWLTRWRTVQRVCGFVGKHSYEAYLAHVLVLTRCSRFLLDHWPEMNRYVFYAVLTVCTVVGAVLIAWAVDSLVSIARRGVRNICGQAKT